MNLQQAIEGYLVHSQVEKKTAQTVANIQWDLERFLQWKGDLALERITTADLRQYLLYHQGRGLSANSVHTIYKVLRAFFRWTAREQLIVQNPIDLISPLKLPQLLPKVLTQQQVENFLAYLKKDKSFNSRTFGFLGDPAVRAPRARGLIKRHQEISPLNAFRL